MSDALPSQNRTLSVQYVELAVFLFLIVPTMLFSFFISNQGGTAFWLAATAMILRDLALLFLVLFFVWRNGEGFYLIGWSVRRHGTEILPGVILFLPFLLITSLIANAFQSAGLSVPPPTSKPSFLTGHGLADAALGTFLVAVVAVSEEAIFRGYLMLRFRTLINPLMAALLSSFIFSLGHGYEGTAGAATVGVMGFIFALIYLWRGNRVAPITMHFLQDFCGVVLVQFMKGH